MSLATLRARLVRGFFFNFFRLLILAISVSQWAVVWWVARTSVAVPWWLHLAGPLAFYLVNRRLARGRRQPRTGERREGVLRRLYYATAFTSVFCGMFLLFTGTLWLASRLILGVLAAEAETGSAFVAAGGSLDAGFRWLGHAGVASIVALLGYGYTVGQNQLRVSVQRLRLRHAPADWHGLRIAQISDIHIGRNLDRLQAERFVRRVNSIKADLLCITGDIADNADADLDTFLPLLGGMRATHGVVAILGNHDHYAGADMVEAALRRHTDWTVLRDEHAALRLRGHDLHVLGLDDRGRDWARGLASSPELDRLLAAVPAEAPALLLSHRPDIFVQAARCGIGLTLAGHTHGGQLAIPWRQGRRRNLAEFVTRFDRGLFARDGSFLYVNCGLGVTGQRVRLWTPREISVFEIDSDAQDTAG